MLAFLSHRAGDSTVITSIRAHTRGPHDDPSHHLEEALMSTSPRSEGSHVVDHSLRPVVAARPGEDSGERSVGQPPSVSRANIPVLLTVRHYDAQFVPFYFDPRHAVEWASIQDDDGWSFASGLSYGHGHNFTLEST
jgi:hypothetical protein